MDIDVTHKRLMQQNCIEMLQSDRESLIQELSLLVVGRDCRDSVAQIIQIIIIIINIIKL